MGPAGSGAYGPEDMSERMTEPVRREPRRRPRQRHFPAPLTTLLALGTAALIGFGLSQIVASLGTAPGPLGLRSGSPAASAPAAGSPLPSMSPVPSPPGATASGGSSTGPSPAQSGRIHVVGPGESLSRIARRYGVTVEAIVQANGLVNANIIRPGQRLVIPGP